MIFKSLVTSCFG